MFDIVEDPRPTFYVPLDQRADRAANVEPAANAIALSVTGDPAPVMSRLREIVGDTGTTIRTLLLGWPTMQPRLLPLHAWATGRSVNTGSETASCRKTSCNP